MSTSRLEHMVLQSLAPDAVLSLASIHQRLPQCKHGSIATALLFLAADRSVRRVKRGMYCLTELGLARIEGGPTP